MNKLRSKYFSLVLYPSEDILHHKAMEYIVNHFDYAIIKHDMDVNENLERIKEHVHIVISFPNYRYLNSLQKELDIPINYIEMSSSLESALKYLIHYNNKEKYQYDISLVSGTLKKKLVEFVERDNHAGESVEASCILDYINNSGIIEFNEILSWVCENDFYSSFRRNYSCFKDIIQEHNKNYYK